MIEADVERHLDVGKKRTTIADSGTAMTALLIACPPLPFAFTFRRVMRRS
jgi:hypothetical protein